MRWLKTRPKYSVGDVRTIRKFAWIPRSVGMYYVWLESYCTRQILIKDIYGNSYWSEIDPPSERYLILK